MAQKCPNQRHPKRKDYDMVTSVPADQQWQRGSVPTIVNIKDKEMSRLKMKYTRPTQKIKIVQSPLSAVILVVCNLH